MVAYRFCRPDDAELLIAAVNACYNVHFDGEPAFSRTSMKAEIKTHQFWSSSCMVASEGDRPIGVLIGAKRPDMTGILRVGVAPQYLRQGHAQHMLDSLSRKLSILGPPLLRAEIPEHNSAAIRLFESLGFEHRATWQTLRARPPNATPRLSGLCGRTTLDTLEPWLSGGLEKPWLSAKTALLARSDQLQGWALGTEGVEAYAVADIAAGTRRVLDLGPPDSPFVPILLHHLACDAPPLVLETVTAAAIESARRYGFAFEPICTYRHYVRNVSEPIL